MDPIAGPSPFPRSSVRANTLKTVPLVSGAFTLSMIARILEPATVDITPPMRATVHMIAYWEPSSKLPASIVASKDNKGNSDDDVFLTERNGKDPSPLISKRSPA